MPHTAPSDDCTVNISEHSDVNKIEYFSPFIEDYEIVSPDEPGELGAPSSSSEDEGPAEAPPKASLQGTGQPRAA